MFWKYSLRWDNYSWSVNKYDIFKIFEKLEKEYNFPKMTTYTIKTYAIFLVGYVCFKNFQTFAPSPSFGCIENIFYELKEFVT